MNLKLKIKRLTSDSITFVIEKSDWEKKFLFAISEFKINRHNKKSFFEYVRDHTDAFDYLALYSFKDWKGIDDLKRQDLTFCFYTHVCDILDDFLQSKLEINITDYLRSKSKMEETINAI